MVQLSPKALAGDAAPGAALSSLAASGAARYVAVRRGLAALQAVAKAAGAAAVILLPGAGEAGLADAVFQHSLLPVGADARASCPLFCVLSTRAGEMVAAAATGREWRPC